MVEEFSFRLPPDLAILAELRQEFAAWLGKLDVISDQDALDLVLAAHEAAANAIEHSRESFGPGQLNAWLVDGELTVEVRDSGTWEADAPPADERGRGLALIESLVQEIQVKKNPRGTTLRLVHRSGRANASRRDAD